MYIWKDESDASPIKPGSSTSTGHNIYEISGQQEDYEMFNYNLECSVGGEDEELNGISTGNKMLAFKFINKDAIFLVSS